MGFEPPHPDPLPCGERERTEYAARLSITTEVGISRVVNIAAA
jgi:hypothetical protein